MDLLYGEPEDDLDDEYDELISRQVQELVDEDDEQARITNLDVQNDDISSGVIAEYRAWYGIQNSDGKASFAPILSRVGKSRFNGTRPHKGIDVFAPFGTRVKTLSSGRAWIGKSISGYGDGVFVLQHVNRRYYLTLYAHLEHFAPKLASRPSRVKMFDVIGYAGCSGIPEQEKIICGKTGKPLPRRSDHVHVEVRRVTKASDFSFNKGSVCNPETFYAMQLRYANEDRRFNPDANGNYVRAADPPFSTIGENCNPFDP